VPHLKRLLVCLKMKDGVYFLVSGEVSAAAIRKSEEATDSQRLVLVGLLELVADK
jgi:hypothetical protein